MERPYILHMFTPGRQMSPFDINMAADAGWQMVVPYAGVGIDDITGLTHDAIFSRGPKGVARTGIVIGGRRSLHGADGGEHARGALVDAEVVLGCAAAGVQVMSAEDLAAAPKLMVAADLNAVPPLGIAGLGLMDNGTPIAGTLVAGIGALAIGNV